MNDTTSSSIDTLLHCRYLIPVVPENTVLEYHSIAIENGRIVDILPRAEAEITYAAAQVTELAQHIVLPGLINAHGHAAMSLLRSYANDLALMDWLNNHIWPAEARWVSDAFVYDGTQLAIGEMLKSGTTCFSDMYFFPEAAARAALDAGVRCQLSFPIFEFPSNWGSGPQEYLEKGLALRDLYRGSDRVKVAFGPHAPYTVGDASLEKVAMLAEELDANIQIHLHETAFEVESAVKESGVRPIERLRKIGLLSPRTQCVHMTTLNDDDIHTVQINGAHIIHCPESNLKLASGFCPVNTLQKAGINVAIGTDGAASNDDLDLFAELRSATLLAKAVANDPTALDAHAAVRMATLNGARALGIDHLVGSLEKDKQADIVAVRIDTLCAQPMYDAASSLVYTSSGSRVSDVWVGGKRLLNERQLTTLDEVELLARAMEWGKKIKSGNEQND
ncbi:MAG TPA: TRZ/ATZ family hydrolase [Pseudomonadales bacterium]|nr:TRZ/ATZ family hydrolase [Pseudomonadales bacterium]